MQWKVYEVSFDPKSILDIDGRLCQTRLAVEVAREEVFKWRLPVELAVVFWKEGEKFQVFLTFLNPSYIDPNNPLRNKISEHARALKRELAGRQILGL